MGALVSHGQSSLNSKDPVEVVPRLWPTEYSLDEYEVVRARDESELEEEPDDVDSNERRLDLMSRRWEGPGESVMLIGPWIHHERGVVKNLLHSEQHT
jgi:hypothetical protein